LKSSKQDARRDATHKLLTLTILPDQESKETHNHLKVNIQRSNSIIPSISTKKWYNGICISFDLVLDPQYEYTNWRKLSWLQLQSYEQPSSIEVNATLNCFSGDFQQTPCEHIVIDFNNWKNKQTWVVVSTIHHQNLLEKEHRWNKRCIESLSDHIHNYSFSHNQEIDQESTWNRQLWNRSGICETELRMMLIQ